MTEGVFAIHENNLVIGSIGAGCLLASPKDLAEMVGVLPGARLKVED